MLTTYSYLHDGLYYPKFFTELGYDTDAIAKQVAAITPADRASAHMRYRGHALKRSKWFFVDSLESVPIYSYPGFTYKSVVAEYKTIASCPIIYSLQQEIKTRFGHECNHVIGTTYYDEGDNIGWHNDKVATLDETMPIYTCSFFQQRPLAFRPNPTADLKEPAVAVEVPMEHGSLTVLGSKTNATHQHAILPARTKLELRISVIFRVVKNRVSMKDVLKRAAK